MTDRGAGRIDPGILPLFRIFVALEILLLLLRLGLEATFRSDFPLVQPVWPGLAFLFALLVYLSVPALQDRLGRWYLPLALVLSVGVTIAAAAAGLKGRLDAGIRAEELVRGSWILIVVLLVPLVIVAWQYGFRWVLGFCALTVASELALTLPLAARGGPPPLTFVVIALVRCLFFVPVGYAVARLARAQREQAAALAEAHARLAESRERDRLALELHDTLAHGLSSVAVQLEATRALWSSQPERSRAMLGDALEATRTALGEARRAIGALRASPLDDLGLAGAIRARAEANAARAGFALDLDIAPLDGVDPQVEHAIYRVATEALANVVRHARARSVSVKLDRTGLLVRDDGAGFDPGAVEGDRFGLRGMRERARIIGAALEIESAPGKGTKVRLTVPER